MRGIVPPHVGITGTCLLNICAQMSLNRRADVELMMTCSAMLAMIFLANRELFCVLSCFLLENSVF